MGVAVDVLDHAEQEAAEAAARCLGAFEEPVAEDEEEGLLAEVLGVLARAALVLKERDDGGAVLLRELVEGGRAAVLGLADGRPDRRPERFPHGDLPL